jgi:hypothetical protein
VVVSDVLTVHGFVPDDSLSPHYSLFEQRYFLDGGVEPAVKLGYWPSAADELYAFQLLNLDDGRWYAAGALRSGKVLTVTRQGTDGGREELRRWLFDGPQIGDAVAFSSYVTPVGLTRMDDGTTVVLGDYAGIDCSEGTRWLFLMGF